MRYTSISDETAESYREKLDRVVVRGSTMMNVNGSGNSAKLHIPADTELPEPLCQVTAHKGLPWVEKDIEVYPPGHKSICKRCVAHDTDETEDYKQYSDSELLTHLERVLRKAPYDVVSLKTYDEYREDNQPCGSVIEKRFESWTAAKAKTSYDP